MPSFPKGLGRLVEHDPRSLSYPAGRAAGAPQRVFWRHWGRVLDQGQVGSCTGNAITHTLMIDPLRVAGRTLNEHVAVDLYSRATELDEFPGSYPQEDTGTSSLAVAKAAVEKGYIDRYEWAFGVDHATESLTLGALMIGSVWHEGMFYPDKQGFVERSGDIVGGHEYVLIGREDDTYVFLNSWSRKWGVHSPRTRSDVSGGCFLMTRDTFGSLLDEQGDVMLPIKSAA
jgi:hypothetical protein